MEERKEEMKKMEQEEAMKCLDALVGLESVKDQIRKIIAQKTLLSNSNNPGYYIFAGNPGTGKTVVARQMARILKAYGILKKGHIVEVSKRDLVEEYVGQSAIKTETQCRRALDGVLFVDEAYELVNTGNTHSGFFSSSFDEEAYMTIMKFMHSNADRVCVIFAGYEDEMDIFKKAHPWLPRQIRGTLHFKDYSDDELLQILEINASQRKEPAIKLSPGFLEMTKKAIVTMRCSSQFGNGRDIVSYLNNCIDNASVRLFDEGLRQKAEQIELLPSDIPEEYKGQI